MPQTASERLQAIYDELPTVTCQRKCQAYCGPLLIPRVEFVQIEKFNEKLNVVLQYKEVKNRGPQ